MKIHNNMTTKYYAKMYLDRLKHQQLERVRDVYGKPSDRKLDIERGIFMEMEYRNGANYTVLTHNTQCFTCAYTMPDPDTGEIILCIETPSRTWYTRPYEPEV